MSMMVMAVAVVGVALSPCSTSTIHGQYSVGGLGQQYLAGDGGVVVSNDNRTLALPHNHRGYFASKCVEGYSSDMYTTISALGKEIRFEVDVSTLSCGCNGAFYLVSMPGSVPGHSQDYYCDANDVNGEWCTEMDIMEANSHGFAITAHACHTNYSSDTCDKGGCGTIKNSLNSGYGVGGSNIDTTRPFNVSIRFHNDDGVLSSIEGILTQPSKPGITITNTCTKGYDYLKAMSGPLSKGMVPVYSQWGTTMTWLDKCPTTETCNMTGKLRISNMQVI